MPDRIRRKRENNGERQHARMWQCARQFLAMAVVAVMACGSLLLKVEAAVGDLDTTFHGDGKQTTNFGANEELHGIAIQADGKIVAAGHTANDKAAVARYKTNGTLDTTFSGDGKLTYDFGGTTRAWAVAIQTDGKIVVAGDTFASYADFALARYNSDGTLDTTFSGDGKQTTDFFGKSDIALAITIQANGKIVLAGLTFNDNTGYDFAVARYNTNGALDTTFSTDGKQTTDFSTANDTANAVAIQPNGKIVVVGVAGASCTSSNFCKIAVARYNTNGAPDTTFSGDGKQTHGASPISAEAHSLAIQSDSKIVVAGYAYFQGNTDFALIRYNGNGSLDMTFNGTGTLTTSFQTGSNDAAYAVSIQSDGKIVLGGFVKSGTAYDFALARYLGD